MPKFSIITVCYNEAAHIRETLDSIVNQTFKDFELIVVDGGSTDGTKILSFNTRSISHGGVLSQIVGLTMA